MTRQIRWITAGLTAVCAVAPFAVRSSAQQAHRPAAAVSKNSERSSRDLATVRPRR